MPFFFFKKKSSTYVPFLFSVSLWDKFSSSFSNHIVLSKKHLQVYNKKNDKVTCYISMYLLQLGLRRGRRVWTLSGKTSGGDRSCPSGLSPSQGVNTPTGLLTLTSSSFFRHIVHLLLWDGWHWILQKSLFFTVKTHLWKHSCTFKVSTCMVEMARGREDDMPCFQGPPT